jgi:hypothetical protein
MALLQQQEPVTREHVGARPTQPLVSPRRLGGEDEPVVEQMKRLDLGIVDGQGDEDKVEVARGQRLAEL